MNLIRAAALVLPTALSGFLTAQTTVTIPCSRDNTLFESPTGANSAGAGNDIYVGLTGQPIDQTRRGLVWFDVAAHVPAGALVISAELTVTVNHTGPTPDQFLFGHRLNQDWGEGTSIPGPGGGAGGGGTGAPATANDATWIHTFFPGSTWTTPGGDFQANSSFFFVISSPGIQFSTGSSIIVSDVQQWANQPGQNFGWLLRSSETFFNSAIRLDSRENTAGSPPSLEVTYLMNGQVANIGFGCLVGGQPYAHAWSGPPIGGTTVQLTQSNGPPNGLAANLMSLTFDPLGSIIGPPCTFHLPFGGLVVTQSLVFLDASGSGASSLTLPSGFPGVVLASQAAALQSTSPGGFVLSNGAVARMQ